MASRKFLHIPLDLSEAALQSPVQPSPALSSLRELLDEMLIEPEQSEFTADFDGATIMLGSGAFGEVHVVRRLADGSEGEYYARKRMRIDPTHDPEYAWMTVCEVATMQQLQSERIVRLIKVEAQRVQDQGTALPGGVSSQTAYHIDLILEPCYGGSIQARMDQLRAAGGAFSEGEIRHVVRQVAKALTYLHDGCSFENPRTKLQGNIIHRDLKADNVLYVNNDPDVEVREVKLIDFNVSRVIGDRFSLATPAVGTAGHIAPELMPTYTVCSSNDPVPKQAVVTPAVDIFSLGAMTFYMAALVPRDTLNLTSQAGLHSYNPEALVADIVTPRGYSEDLCKLMASMLAFDANGRPTAQQVVDRLTASPMV